MSLIYAIVALLLPLSGHALILKSSALAAVDEVRKLEIPKLDNAAVRKIDLSSFDLKDILIEIRIVF